MTDPTPVVDANPAADTNPATDGGRGGPPAWFTFAAIGSLIVAVGILVLAVMGVGVGFRIAEPTIAPTGQASEVTRSLVVRALQAASFQVQDPLAGYRPGESPDLVHVPRRLVQVVMPEDPGAGFVVIYELPTADEADRIGGAFLRYLAGGTGAVQYPRDARFVLQRVGPTLVFYAWSAEASPDARVAELAAALETVGSAVRPSP